MVLPHAECELGSSNASLRNCCVFVFFVGVTKCLLFRALKTSSRAPSKKDSRICKESIKKYCTLNTIACAVVTICQESTIVTQRWKEAQSSANGPVAAVCDRAVECTRVSFSPPYKQPSSIQGMTGSPIGKKDFEVGNFERGLLAPL